jgi:hydroxymethylglutaryl-CoA reductase
MIENCIGKFSLPLGLGLNFLINNKHYVVPMAVEEPSIIGIN